MAETGFFGIDLFDPEKMVFITAQDEAVVIQGSFVYRLDEPVYAETEISAGWEPYGCPGGYRRGNQAVAIGNAAWNHPIHMTGQPGWTCREGVMYNRQLIGWREKRIWERVVKSLMGNTLVAHEGQWIQASDLDANKIRRRVEDAIRKYARPDKENLILELAIRLGCKLT